MYLFFFFYVPPYTIQFARCIWWTASHLWDRLGWLAWRWLWKLENW